MDNRSTTYKGNKEEGNGLSFFRLRSDRLIFFICILIASLFWLLIKLSGVYSTNYTFKVTFNNVPADLRLTKLIDSTLDLKVTARGFSILKMNIFDDMENLDINLNNYSIENKGGIKYTIYTQELTNKLAEVMNIDESEIRLSKPMLSFEMEKTSERRIPIVPDYSISFVDQYDLYNGVIANPEYVMVYGPESVLDTLTKIFTEKLLLENVMHDQDITVSLQNPDPKLLSFDNNEVVLGIDIEKFTESEITVSVNLSNLPYKIKVFPSQVQIFYRVAQIDFNEVRAQQFNVYPMLDNMDIQKVQKLPLKLSKQPDFVRNVRIVPSDVEFLIIK